jgi:dual specificity phosphatase 12
MRFLAEKQITAVLSVCNDFVPAEDHSLGMMHYRIPIADEPTADLLITLPNACMFIATALAQGRNILIHSGRGQSRAPAVVAAYRESATLPCIAFTEPNVVMQTYGLEVGMAMERLRKGKIPNHSHTAQSTNATAAHEPTWLIPAFQEQLFLFALCAYRPGPGVSYYDAWKARIQAA